MDNFEVKICKICHMEKPLSEFRKTMVKGKAYYRSTCKKCIYQERKDYLQQYEKANKEKLKEYRKDYYNLTKDHKLEYQSEYRKENEDKIKESRKKYNSSNYEKTKNYKKNYYLNNKEDLSLKFKEYYENNKEVIREQRSIYYSNNKDKVNEYVRTRKKTDKLFKLKCQVRNMLWESFNRKNSVKKNKSSEILGCDLDFFLEHLMKTFFDNYGKEWDGIEEVHVDHIIPLSTAKTEEEVLKLCHYTNLQLLKGKDNLLKGDKIDWQLKDQ